MRATAAILVTGFIQFCVPQPPDVEPPIAKITFECLSDDCLVMELSAEESEGLEEVSWAIDGTDYGSDEVFAIDVPGRALLEIELTVTNTEGTDTTKRHVMTTPVYPNPVDPDPTWDPSTALVIVGAQSCDSMAVISTVGGCFTGSKPLEHRVARDRFGLVSRSVLDYDPVDNALGSTGYAVAARWRNDHDQNNPNHSPTTMYFNSTAADYGQPPNQPFLNLHGNGTTNHITSYYPIGTGDIMEFEFTHGVYLGDPDERPIDALRIDCSTGTMSVQASPLYENPSTGN